MQCLVVSLFAVSDDEFVCSVWWSVCVQCLVASLYAVYDCEFVRSVWW